MSPSPLLRESPIKIIERTARRGRGRYNCGSEIVGIAAALRQLIRVLLSSAERNQRALAQVLPEFF
jgi:hypothetical protein